MTYKNFSLTSIKKAFCDRKLKNFFTLAFIAINLLTILNPNHCYATCDAQLNLNADHVLWNKIKDTPLTTTPSSEAPKLHPDSVNVQNPKNIVHVIVSTPHVSLGTVQTSLNGHPHTLEGLRQADNAPWWLIDKKEDREVKFGGRICVYKKDIMFHNSPLHIEIKMRVK